MGEVKAKYRKEAISRLLVGQASNFLRWGRARAEEEEGAKWGRKHVVDLVNHRDRNQTLPSSLLVVEEIWAGLVKLMRG